MASNITLSAGVRQNLLSLQNTASLMSTTQNRLATGKKVNSALDNPTSFFTAQSLQSRAGDMSALLDNMTSGIKTLEAADNGLSAITKTVESMQSTLRQARQDKSFKTESYTINLGTTPAGTEEISFQGGAVGTTAVDVALTGTTGAAAATVSTGAFTAMDFNPAAATSGTITSGAFGSTLTFDNAGDELEVVVEVNGVNQTLTIDATAVAATLGVGVTTITDADELAQVLDDLATGTLNVTSTGTAVTFTSSTTGTGSSIEIISATATNGGGANTITNTSGIAVAAQNTGSATGTARTLSFDIAIDGAVTPTTVTINAAAVALVGDNDNIIDTVAELASIIDAQVGAGATIGSTATAVTFTSATTGVTSEIDISNVAVAGSGGFTNTSGLATANDLGAATGGIAAKTVDEMVTAINGTAALEGKVRASNDGGKLRIENLSTSELTVTGLDATTGELTGGVGTSDIGGNTVRTNLVKQFNELRDQLDKLADDASFNGVNLLRGDLLKLTFNETGTSTIEIQAKDEDGEERAINSATLGIDTATDPDFDSDEGIDAILDGMKDALGVLRAQSSSFGSNLSIVQNRTEFTKSMINTLQTGADSLVLADTNEEAANMLALQTRQQLSSTALSLASQADQAVLRLF
ncbi:flagellin [Terrihabitans soli]|uniref:Flagellin n=1 Tax=Terrihabitans soli TaxID=708113 RepID=A0A6S6QQ26_9HYPH|nr:flagellin [Terrihabitans soli]BCJ91626.1 flagellin [Terrihabitans soli]